MDYISEDSTQFSQNALISQEHFWTDQSPAWKQNSMKSIITERIESQTSCENHLITPTLLDLDDVTAPLRNSYSIMEVTDDPLEKRPNLKINENHQDLPPARSNSIKRSRSLLNRQYNRIKTIIEWFENNMLS